jgi:sugar phosphate permease
MAFLLTCPHLEQRFKLTTTFAMTPQTPPNTPALDRARRKAYLRLLPLLFVSYMIAYVDRQNVAVAKLTMTRDGGSKVLLSEESSSANSIFNSSSRSRSGRLT